MDDIANDEKNPGLYIPEKQFATPTTGVEDRIFLKFDAANPAQSKSDFSQLYFKVNAPTSEAVLKNCFLVIPLRFKFRNREGQLVSDRKIALKSDGLDRIFRSVRISINGTFFTDIPFDKIHHEFLSPSLSYFDKLDGNLLPVSENPDVVLPAQNKAWEERCAYFQQFKEDSFKDTWDVASNAYVDHGQSFAVDLRIQLDTGPLTNYLRSQYENVNSTVPFAYEMDITVQYNNSWNGDDGSDLVKSGGQPCWGSIFEIEQPISRLACERKGYGSDRRYITKNRFGDTHNLGNTTGTGFRPMMSEHIGLGYVRCNNATHTDFDNANVKAAALEWLKHVPMDETYLGLRVEVPGGVGAIDCFTTGLVNAAAGKPTLRCVRIHSIVFGGGDTFVINHQTVADTGAGANAGDGDREWILIDGLSLLHTDDCTQHMTFYKKNKTPLFEIDYFIRQAGNIYSGQPHGLGERNGHSQRTSGGRRVMGPMDLNQCFAWCGGAALRNAGGVNYYPSNMRELEYIDRPAYKGGAICPSLGETLACQQKLFAVRVTDDFPKCKKVKLLAQKSNKVKTVVLANVCTLLATTGQVVAQRNIQDPAVDANVPEVTTIWTGRYDVQKQSNTQQLTTISSGVESDKRVLLSYNQASVPYPNALKTAANTATDSADWSYHFSNWKNQTGELLQGNAVTVDQYPSQSYAQWGQTEDQQQFMGGECMVIPCDHDISPIVAIEAEYRDVGKTAYLMAECIHSSSLKQEYVLDDGRRDIHLKQFKLGDLIDGKLPTQFFHNVLIVEGWSQCVVYCCLAEESRDVEMETSGLAGLLLDVRESRLQYCESHIWDYDVDSWHLYRQFVKTFSACELTYAQWVQYRNCIAFRTQDLAYAEVQESRKKLGNINFSCNVKLTDCWKKIIDRYSMEETYLGTSTTKAKFDPTIMSSSPDAFLKYLRKLKFELRVVLEYTNYGLHLDNTGGVKRERHHYPSIGPSGLNRKVPISLGHNLRDPLGVRRSFPYEN